MFVSSGPVTMPADGSGPHPDLKEAVGPASEQAKAKVGLIALPACICAEPNSSSRDVFTSQVKLEVPKLDRNSGHKF